MGGRILALLLTTVSLAAQTVEGTIVSPKAGALPGVSVTLLKGKSPFEATQHSTVTDAQGSFRLDNVEEGVYVFDLQVEGFAGPVPATPGNRPFVVSSGGAPKSLRLEMMPLGRVSVRVVDPEGSPVPGAALEFAADYGLSEQETAGADGRFTFRNLRPGSYKLLAVAPPGWKSPAPVDGQPMAWVPTFFGGVPDREGAASIRVVPGGEFVAPDLKLLAAPAYPLRGTVLDPAGNIASGVKVFLWVPNARAQEWTTVSAGNGSFEFPKVTDGPWRLSAETGSGASKMAAWVSVQMAGKELDRVTLHLMKPFPVHGRVSFDPPEGAIPPSSIGLISKDLSATAASDVKGDGRFTAEGVYPGIYGIGIAPALPDPRYYLDSIRVGDRDALAREVEIVSEFSPISITFKAGSSAVRGSVEDCGAAVVLLLPQDPAMRRQGLTRQTRCSEGDHFEILSVRPGEYYLFAFAPNSAPLVPPHDLDQEYLNHAVKLTVANNAGSLVNLKVIPSRGF